MASHSIKQIRGNDALRSETRNAASEGRRDCRWQQLAIAAMAKHHFKRGRLPLKYQTFKRRRRRIGSIRNGDSMGIAAGVEKARAGSTKPWIGQSPTKCWEGKNEKRAALSSTTAHAIRPKSACLYSQQSPDFSSAFFINKNQTDGVNCEDQPCTKQTYWNRGMATTAVTQAFVCGFKNASCRTRGHVRTAPTDHRWLWKRKIVPTWIASRQAASAQALNLSPYNDKGSNDTGDCWTEAAVAEVET